MQRFHTSSSCFHYPSGGHWPCTKAPRTELHLLSPWSGFYCGTYFPSHSFTVAPLHFPSLQTLSLLKWMNPSFQRQLKSSKSFCVKKKTNPSFQNQVISMKHKNATPLLISLMKRCCDNFISNKPESIYKNGRKGCDFHSLPGKLLPSASACHSPSAPCVPTSPCFSSLGGS